MSVFFVYSVCVYTESDVLCLIQARQGMNQHSNMYSGQVQQHGQSSYYSNTQSPSSAMQQVTSMMVGYNKINMFLLIEGLVILFLNKLFNIVCLDLSLGDCPTVQFTVVPAKLWLGWRPASPGTAPNSSPGPAPQHQPAAPCFPAIQRHHGPQPQHDAASHQQGVCRCSCTYWF